MAFQTTTRPTQAVIDLDALAFNFHASKEFIGPGVRYMAVVKADAYGHGAIECAKRLEAEGVDWLGVAIPEEGVELRHAGIKTRILCLGSFWPGQEEIVVQNALTPVVYDERAASDLDAYCRENSRSVDIHVKIDTGMGRVGVRHEGVATFAKFLQPLKNLRATGLLTHFASAEDPRQDDFTKLQIERFDAACRAFREAGHDPQIFDMANSPGAIGHPDSRGNLVRLGGALYGLLDDILPANATRPTLKPVLSLTSRIAYIKRIPAGESLGYGRTFFTERDSLIGLVPLGYDDGYPRGLSNRGKACVRGAFAPIVGRISMDWTLLDVTDIRGAAVDDEVVLIGAQGECSISAADIARQVDTIGYEIACGISPRVPRIFVGKN